MRNKEIESSLKRSINQAPALDLKVLLDMPYLKMKEHDFITRQEEPARHQRKKDMAIGTLCAALLLCFTIGWYVQNRVPNSIISLDVNPSIEIVTNRRDRVLAVHAINKDAKHLLENQDYSMTGLNSTVNTIVADTINSGYLSSEKNVILVSVENKDIEKAASLASTLDGVIKSSASEYGITPQVLSQTFTKDKDITAAARRLRISVGKLRLIQKILLLDVDRSAEDLAVMSMEELLTLASSRSDGGEKENGVVKPGTDQENKAAKPGTDQENKEDTQDEASQEDEKDMNSDEAQESEDTSKPSDIHSDREDSETSSSHEREDSETRGSIERGDSKEGSQERENFEENGNKERKSSEEDSSIERENSISGDTRENVEDSEDNDYQDTGKDLETYNNTEESEDTKAGSNQDAQDENSDVTQDRQDTNYMSVTEENINEASERNTGEVASDNDSEG